MNRATLAVMLLWGFGDGQGWGQVPYTKEYVISEIHYPVTTTQIDQFFWGRMALPQMDFNGDFVLDRFVSGFGGDSGGSISSYVDFRFGPTSLGSHQAWVPYLSYNFQRIPTLLGSPLGPRFITEDYLDDPQGIHVIDLKNGSVLGAVPIPTGWPSGIPDPQFVGFYNAGDQNGDGYDDLFWDGYVTSINYLGLIDGRTFHSIWKYVEVTYGNGNSFARHPDVGPFPDLNGDGLPDLALSFQRYNWSTLAYEHTHMAFAGNTGNILWRSDGLFPSSAQLYGPDVTGDGVAEIATALSGWVQLLDGATGNLLWEIPWSAALSFLPPGVTVQSVGNPMAFERSVDDGSWVLSAYAYGSTSTFPYVSGDTYLRIDPVTGQVLIGAIAPTHMSPWGTVPPTRGDLIGGYQFLLAFGDANRDGLPEFQVADDDYAHTPAYVLAGSNPNYSEQLVTFQQKTLFVPDRFDVLGGSGQISFDVTIPTGGGKSFVVLLSSAFDPEGGWHFDGWPTHLAESPLLAMTRSTLPIGGTLNSLGQGRAFYNLPASTNLIGQTLYSKAIILNPPGSAERVWTTSTVGFTELQ